MLRNKLNTILCLKQIFPSITGEDIGYNTVVSQAARRCDTITAEMLKIDLLPDPTFLTFIMRPVSGKQQVRSRI